METIRNHTVMTENSLSTLQLVGIALSRAKIVNGVVWSVLEKADFHEVDHPTGQVIGVADLLLSCKSSIISAEFAGTDERNVRFSFRAKDGFEVGQAASKLGGGGHARAGGGTLFDMTAIEAAKKAIPMLTSQNQNNQKPRGA